MLFTFLSIFLQPHLKLIYEGKAKSERHRIFKSGTIKEKSNLKRMSGFGPIKESEVRFLSRRSHKFFAF